MCVGGCYGSLWVFLVMLCEMFYLFLFSMAVALALAVTVTVDVAVGVSMCCVVQLT